VATKKRKGASDVGGAKTPTTLRRAGRSDAASEPAVVALPVKLAGAVGYLSPLALGASPVGVLWALPVLPAVLLVAARRRNLFLAAHVRTSVNIQLWYLIGMFAGFGVLTSSPTADSLVGLIDLGVSAVVSAAASLLWLAGPLWGVFRLWRNRPLSLPRPLRLLDV
jgi:hypothetical protein